MHRNVMLIKPTISLQQQYFSFYREWKASGEPMVPWVISKDPSDFEGMILALAENEKGDNLPEGWVRDSTYWLISEDKDVIGAVNIRHQLNEKLLYSGGHIGYGIRPSERRRGYATELLRLSLAKAKELGIHKALVVCDAANVASERTIRNNGGIPDTDYIEEDGNVIKRFWLDT
ncbi:GNAT family N-acetyltransferase [Paenibacillus spongiae]|uniref:GNAT family N-acetyltransferase n=1 Tax=Paenibacillus spongiae TaxID=2909671 RepID=A0ABY5SGG4_9BACL|nr:GNAT family N-acetyltransferase [Paenibacillus spongiae]UVI32744.1 GNAT family N-acetyltransferase [Paenibacillus spongiae]